MKKAVQRTDKNTIRVWGLGWVTPKTAALLVLTVAVLFILVFKFHL